MLKKNLSCIENSDVHKGHSLAIVGTGPSAQSIAMWVKLLGIAPVVVFGRSIKWAGRFAELGVDAYVAGDNFTPEVQGIMKNGGFDRAIEAVGLGSALSRCLHIVKSNGKVNLYGMPADDEPYNRKEESDPRVFRAKVAEAKEHDKLLRWIDQRKVNLADWVSHSIPWTEYQRGFDLVKEKKARKVVLTFN